jgi:ribosomal protein S14
MKYLLVKDKKKRISVKKNELKRLVLKSVNYNLSLNNNLRKQSWIFLNNIERNSTFIRVKNRCVLSNRTRFIFNKYKVSRIVFKNLVSICEINGVYKKNW